MKHCQSPAEMQLNLEGKPDAHKIVAVASWLMVQVFETLPLTRQVGNYSALFSQALPRDAHSTPFYCTRPQSLALGYSERSAGLSASLGTSGISSLGVYSLNGPTPTPQCLLAG